MKWCITNTQWTHWYRIIRKHIPYKDINNFAKKDAEQSVDNDTWISQWTARQSSQTLRASVQEQPPTFMPPIDALDLAHTGSPVEPTCLHHDRFRLLYSYGIQQIERAYSNVARRGLQYLLPLSCTWTGRRCILWLIMTTTPPEPGFMSKRTLCCGCSGLI